MRRDWKYTLRSGAVSTAAPLLVLAVLALAWWAWPRGGQVVTVKMEGKRLSPPRTPAKTPDRVIVKLKESSATVSAVDVATAGGARFLRRMRGDGRLVLSTEGTDTVEVLARLRRQPGVAYAELDGYLNALGTPNDEYYSYQWNFPQLGVAEAWGSQTGRGVTVAVVDTGVAYENFSDGMGRYHRIPDLGGTSFAPGYDFANRDAHPNDDNGHGTHVAGTIAQTTNNRVSEAGIAYGARVMPVKVLSAEGYGYVSDVADGITWAADHGAKVINLSLGSDTPYRTLEDAVNYARHTKGVVVVAAAGNSGAAELGYPAAYDAVVAVGATRYDRRRTYYSQYGAGLDLVAPGGDMEVDQNSDGYGDGILQQTIGIGWGAGDPTVHNDYFLEGTSMASPHVAAVAALVLSAGADAERAEDALRDGATDLGTAGYDTGYGYGLVSATGALQAVNPGPASRMSVPIHSTGLSDAAEVVLRWAATPRAGTGVTDYRIQYMDRNTSSLAWKNWRTFTAATRNAEFPARPGHTYFFRMQARDDGGNWGNWSTVKKSIVPLDDGSLSGRRGFRGARTSAGSDYYLGTVRYSRRAGEWVRFTAYAKRISLIGTAGSRSRAKVYVDGAYLKTIDPGVGSGPRKVLFTRGWARPGTHTITVINLATPGRPQFDVDGFAIQRR